MDRSVRMRSCSMPVALEMSNRVPRKLLVVAVYRVPPETEEEMDQSEEIKHKNKTTNKDIIFSMSQTVYQKSNKRVIRPSHTVK